MNGLQYICRDKLITIPTLIKQAAYIGGFLYVRANLLKSLEWFTNDKDERS